MKFLLDANVLLRARQPSHPLSADCQELLDPSRRPRLAAYLCAQTAIEYWVVATRPQAVNGLGLDPVLAQTDLSDFLIAFKPLPEPPNVLDLWLKLVRTYNVKGLPSHDARLVALMDAHGITGLITINPRDFTRYPHRTVLTPQQWLAANPRQSTP